MIVPWITLVLVVVVAIVLSWVRELRRESPLTRPLATIARFYGRVFIVYVVGWGAYRLWTGFGGDGGPRGSLCVNTDYPFRGGAGAFDAAKAGASVFAAGNVWACALHPGLSQWVLYLLTRLPGIVLWGVVLLLISRLIRRASRSGPFTPQVATTMRQLGWVVLGGSLIAGALSALGADLMTRMLMTPATYDDGGIALHVLLAAPFKAVTPVPAIAGAVLMSFAQIIRAGIVLDEEIKGTV